MKKLLSLFLGLAVASGLLSGAASADITKSIDEDTGEIGYSSHWKSGVFEDFSFEKFQTGKTHDEWLYLLKVKVVKPNKIGLEPIEIDFKNRYYRFDSWLGGESDWRPYTIGEETPKHTDDIISDIAKEDRIHITLRLSDGTVIKEIVPADILQEWKSIIKLKQ
jgi:hypothetical protein